MVFDFHLYFFLVCDFYLVLFQKRLSFPARFQLDLFLSRSRFRFLSHLLFIWDACCSSMLSHILKPKSGYIFFFVLWPFDVSVGNGYLCMLVSFLLFTLRIYDWKPYRWLSSLCDEPFFVCYMHSLSISCSHFALTQMC